MHVKTKMSVQEAKPEQVASWVKDEDKVPLLLALSLYATPRTELNGYVLVHENSRFAVWVNRFENRRVVGLRGTSAFKADASKDIKDDEVRSGGQHFLLFYSFVLLLSTIFSNKYTFLYKSRIKAVMFVEWRVSSFLQITSVFPSMRFW